MGSLVRINASVFVFFFFFFVIIIFISLGKGRKQQGQLSLGDNDDNSILGFVSAFTLTVFHSKVSSCSSILPVRPCGHAVALWSYNGGDDDKNKNIPIDSAVSYKGLIDILSNADYMNVETKNRFLASLKEKFPDGVFNDDGIIVATTTTTTAKAKSTKETESKRGSGGGGSVSTIEGPWKDDGGPFHTAGAWQTKPLLMRGAFLDDIIIRDNNNNISRSSSSSSDNEEESYPFPVWNQIIDLACHGSGNNYDEDDDDDDHPNEASDSGYEYDDHDHKDDMWNDVDEKNEMDDDDDEDEDEGVDVDVDVDVDEDVDVDVDEDEGGHDEDEDEDGYLWKDEDDDYEDYDNGDKNDFAPSRIIQYGWPQRDDQEDSYYHADVNHNWLDTFEIKQFGPFNDQNSVETLLRGVEDPSNNKNTNNKNNTARTLLVNDVDRWFPKLSRWMDRRFNNAADGAGSVLPARWRRDDAQISLSYKSGGIGPHVDDYDVFLIQVEGERTWDILWDDDSDEIVSPFVSIQDETDCILPESSVNGVRILNVTKLQALQQQRYGHKTATKLTRLHLRPGDCLYLPPRVLHCGTAISSESSNGGCMTLSVGCRAPSALELVDGLSDLMKKAATTTTDDKATATMTPKLSTDKALQSFHKRYTNAEVNSDDENGNKGNDYHYFEDTNNALIPSSSWLSPKVKKEMKNLILDAVRTALDDDENILDPLVGKFVTRSNRLEENDFGGDGSSNDSLFSSFSYPKPLRNILEENWNDEMDTDEWKEEFKIWANVSKTIKEVFKEPIAAELNRDKACLRRAEGIAFAWSFVYDKERGVRHYRLYAQGRPPFEVLENPVVVPDETADDASKQSMISSSSSSVVGQLMNRIANGQPLDRAFVMDELKINIDDEEKDTKYTVTRLLYDLVEEGLLYGEYSNHLGLVRRGQRAQPRSENFS
jgi:ribosomal protein L16 Arg81 hydroxylase